MTHVEDRRGARGYMVAVDEVLGSRTCLEEDHYAALGGGDEFLDVEVKLLGEVVEEVEGRHCALREPWGMVG